MNVSKFSLARWDMLVTKRLGLSQKAGLATSIFGVLEFIRIRPNPTLYRIRPNPEPISVGSKCPCRLYNTAKDIPAGLLGIRPHPSESDPPPNPSESRTAIPAERWTSVSPCRGHLHGPRALVDKKSILDVIQQLPSCNGASRNESET